MVPEHTKKKQKRETEQIVSKGDLYIEQSKPGTIYLCMSESLTLFLNSNDSARCIFYQLDAYG